MMWCKQHGYKERPNPKRPPVPVPGSVEQAMNEALSECPECDKILYKAEECGCVILDKGSPAEYKAKQCPYHEGIHKGLILDIPEDNPGATDTERRLRGILEGVRRRGQIQADTERLNTV